MHSIKSGLIGLDGAVAHLTASHDVHSYARALSQYYALLKLRARLHERPSVAKGTPNETKDAAA
jgi:hypothetical protein